MLLNCTPKIIKMIYFMLFIFYYSLKIKLREFPGGPVVRTPHFHCQGPGFSPWSGS